VYKSSAVAEMSDRLATIDMGRNWLCPPHFGRELGPISHNMASPEAYLRTKWHLDPSSCLATIDMGRKVGAMPLFRREMAPPFNTMSLGPRPTSLPSGFLIHPVVWPQKTWAKNRGLCPHFFGGVEWGSWVFI